MRQILLVYILFLSLTLHAQSLGKQETLSGNFSAIFDGVEMSLFIEHQSGSSYTGILNDSYQACPLVLDLSGSTFTGVLTEPTTGVEIEVNGEIRGKFLIFSFVVDPYGGADAEVITFTRNGDENSITGTSEQSPSKVQLPAGASHPQEMTGTWTKEELYQSGSGDAYMGAGFSESVTFLPGGGLAEGGSGAYISGSHYSGQSTGQGNGLLPGVTWYTIGNQLYMQVTENNQTQNVHLGKYFIENNNMLITATNGEKVLLTRSN